MANQQSFLQKIAGLSALAALFIFSGIVIFQLQTAFGWANPGQNPPSAPGALYYNAGNVGINTANPSTTLTVAGQISATLNKIVDVGSPTSDYDAANKLYVDAAAGGQTFTVFGVGSSSMPWDPLTGMYTQVTVPGGTGVPSCPAGYGSILDGYGPHGVVAGTGWNTPFSFQSPDQGGFWDDEEMPGNYQKTIVNSLIAPTYSTCSYSEYQIIPTAVPQIPTGGGDYYNYLVSKACETFIDGVPPFNSAFRVCNTCRVCLKGYQGGPVGPGSNVPVDSRWP